MLMAQKPTNAHDASISSLTLPVYEELAIDDVNRINHILLL